MRRLLISLFATILVLPLVGGAASAADEDYDVQIRRTSNGITHIEAADYGSLGFGSIAKRMS